MTAEPLILSVPGTVEGLIQPGCVVFWAGGPVTARKVRVIAMAPPDRVLIWPQLGWEGRQEVVYRQPVQSMRLSLAERESRRCAVEWIAQKMVPNLPMGVAFFERDGNGWHIVLGDRRHELSWTATDLGLDDALADDTRLPDGYRRVDAEALRRIVLLESGIWASRSDPVPLDGDPLPISWRR